MSENMELLNSIADAEITGDEEHIVINRDRTISVPESLKRIAIQYDHNVRTVTFDCPRYWDGRDLFAMAISINYKRMDGEEGTFIADKVVIDRNDETIIHFDWTITMDVTMVEGSLIFMVCAKKIDESTNTVTNYWNSDLNEDMYVTKGMKCTNTVVTLPADEVTQLIAKVVEAERQLALVATAVETNSEDIEELRGIIEPLIPRPEPAMFPIEATWYKGTTDKATITEVHIVDTYTPDGTETESWNADVEDSGSIRCYVSGTTLVIAGNGAGSILLNPQSNHMFEGWSALTCVTGTDILDTSTVKYFEKGFYECRALTTLDVSNWDTSSVINMGYLFANCFALTALDVSNWDTSSVVSMRQMFNQCQSLTMLDLSNWKSHSGTSMTNMFKYNYKLAQISIGSEFILKDTYLPSPDKAYIPGADGLWYTEDITGTTVGYTYVQVTIDNAGKAATYRAVK
jgi:surface protein